MYMKKLTIVEKAKRIHPIKKQQKIEPEKIELAVAWLKDEISMSQVARVLGIKDVSAYVVLARGAKHYFKTLPEKECQKCKNLNDVK